MRDTRYTIRNLMWLVWLVTIVFSTAAFTSEFPEPFSVESGVFDQACALIYQGKFDDAGELIKQSRQDRQADLSEPVETQLLQIVDEHKNINQLRQSARIAAYAEQLKELEKLHTEADANGLNDVNDIVAVLSVIAKTSEFAGQEQEEQLLSDEFVKEVLQKAIDKAAEYEVEGKWLKAYSNCYVWLEAIDPNNEGYSDYAQRLLDKAVIELAFEDSPCETSKERFQGVKKELFLRAINFLALHYVSIINYGQMATKAIEHCKLLTEVIKTSSQFNVDLQNDSKDSPRLIKYSWEPQKLAAWSSALTALLKEVEYASGGPEGFDKNKFTDVFEKVLKLNETTVNLSEPILVAQFAEAALSALDPYTVIVWPRQVQDFEQMMTNEFTGIGIEISKQKGLLTVSSLLLDTPAFDSALDAGDVIEAVDGVSTKDMSLGCAAKKIKGPAGTKVTLRVRRSSEDKTVEDKVFDVTITRDKIVVPTIRGWQRTSEGKWLYMIDEKSKIGFVRITSFSAETASGLEKVLSELESEGLKGLILDLRFNTGGLLESAVEVADKFLEGGLIVKRQPGFGRMPVYEPAQKKGTHPDYPLVILINSNSASASEIVAGALADKAHKRAILVGNRTHGKGSVQGITGYLGGGAQLKYTMAYYHLPSGQRVESRNAMEKQDRKDWGVGPNVEVELRSDEIKKMIEVQRHNDVLVKADHNNANHDFTKHTIEETLAVDPQLAVGLLIVRSQLIHAEAPAQARLNN